MIDKERTVKLEKKLEQRKLTVYEALQEQVIVDWLKTNNPAFLSMLNPQATIQIINLMITPGHPADKMRSFKIPMIAAQLLSTMIPKVYQLLFVEDPQDKHSVILGRLLKYFDTAPNYVISGYVVRILMNLMPANPSRVLQFVYKCQPERMLKFLESQSIAEYLLRIIIVEDALLNVQIKERVALLGQIVNLYIQNKADQQILANTNWMLCQAVNRLWSQKHKQLGRFSGTLFRLVEGVIDHNNLYQQQSLLVAVSKQVSVYQKQAPFLIAALYKKIQQELSLGRGETNVIVSNKISQPKLTVRRYKYLQALFFIIAHGADAIAKQLPSVNVFFILFDYITKYQWHSLALVEIQKIMRAAVTSTSQSIFMALTKSYFIDKLKEYARIQTVQNKFGYGFSGLLKNIVKLLKQSLQSSTGYGGWLKKTQGEGDLNTWINEYLGRHKDLQESVRVVHEVTKPFYNISKLPDHFAQFFEQTEAINKRMQSESPSKHLVQQKQVLQQIQNQNQLVYKLMTQLVAETVLDEKKPQSQSNE